MPSIVILWSKSGSLVIVADLVIVDPPGDDLPSTVPLPPSSDATPSDCAHCVSSPAVVSFNAIIIKVSLFLYYYLFIYFRFNSIEISRYVNTVCDEFRASGRRVIELLEYQCLCIRQIDVKHSYFVRLDRQKDQVFRVSHPVYYRDILEHLLSIDDRR